MPKTLWTCCECDKSFDEKRDAEACEKTHDPFIRIIDQRGRDVRSQPDICVLIPSLGDVIVTADAIAKAIEANAIEWKGRYIS